jgi:hypothetical protein
MANGNGVWKTLGTTVIGLLLGLLVTSAVGIFSTDKLRARDDQLETRLHELELKEARDAAEIANLEQMLNRKQ